MTAATAMVGRIVPRIWTPPVGDLTLGGEAVRFADRVCGTPPLPWQAWLLDRALELREPWDGVGTPPFRFRTVLVVVARQNGKTFVLRMRALAGLFLWGEQLAVSLAQNRDVAYEPWREAAFLCDTVPALRRDVRHVYHANGKECIELFSGGRWKVVAPNAGGRGLSADAIYMDELRQQKDWEVWGSIEKARSARPRSQLWAFSSAGDDESVVLNTFVELGRRCADDPALNPTFGYFEYSAPEDADPADPAAWAAANPAFGTLITDETVRAELATDPATRFATERLCIRVSRLTSWLPAGLWAALEVEEARPPSSSVTFAADASPDLNLAVVAAAAGIGDDRVHIELVDAIYATDQEPAPVRLGRYVANLLGRYPHAECVYDGGGPVAGTMLDLAAAGVRVRALNATDVRTASVRFHELAVSRRIVHRPDDLLALHVENAAPNDRGNAWTFSRRHAAGPVTALVSVVLAAHAARNPPPEPPKAANWSAF